MATADAAAKEAINRPRLPGVLLGTGLGGFVDGILLHQILQWHHMLTAYDLGFLAFGALLVIGGWLLARSDQRRFSEPS